MTRSPTVIVPNRTGQRVFRITEQNGLTVHDSLSGEEHYEGQASGEDDVLSRVQER